MQLQAARALFNKGITQGQLDDGQAAIVTYDDVVRRYGDGDMSEIQALVAKSFLNKAETEVHLGYMEETLQSCDEVIRRCSFLADKEKGVLERQSRWVRTRALLSLEQDTAAIDQFRSIYAMFDSGEDAIVDELLEQVPNLISAGASVRDVITVLTDDSEKADRLVPLVVALRQRAGEAVRAPAEVMEIVEDIQKKIDSKLHSGNGAA